LTCPSIICKRHIGTQTPPQNPKSHSL
jgi:hypothetical protein